MKKFFAKLVLFSTISLIASSFSITTSFAQAEDSEGYTNQEEGETANPKEVSTIAILANTLTDAKENPCVKNENKTDPDYNYIITILEEPLTLKEEGKAPDDEYVTRICFRNHFSYKDTLEGKRRTIDKLSTICSEDIKQFNERYQKYQTEYEIKYACDPVQVILSKGGTSLIEGYIGSIYRWGASIAGIIAVLIIVFSGIQIAAAGGEPQTIEDAKKRIVKSLAGLVVLFLSGLILYTINPNFFIR